MEEPILGLEGQMWKKTETDFKHQTKTTVLKIIAVINKNNVRSDYIMVVCETKFSFKTNRRKLS